MNIAQRQSQILTGMDYLAVLAKDRLSAAQEQLAEGDFDAAYDRTREALEKLQPLMYAQNGMSAYAQGKRIVRAADLQAGMVVVNRGVVESTEEVEHPGGLGTCVQVTLEGDAQELHMPAEAELVVDMPDGAGQP